MVRFVPDMPIATDAPSVAVDGGMLPGRYVFQLIVVDDEGNESRSDEQVVVVSLGEVSPWLRLLVTFRLLLRFLFFR